MTNTTDLIRRLEQADDLSVLILKLRYIIKRIEVQQHACKRIDAILRTKEA